MPLTVARAPSQTLGGVVTANPGGLSVASGGGGGLQGNTYNPQISNPTRGGSSGRLASASVPDFSYSTDTGGGGGGQSAADAAAAKAAAEQAQAVQSARGQITSLAHSILDIYDSLYGNVKSAAADQGKQLSQKYDTESTGLVDEFNRDFPTIGQNYAARGAFDSSYRQDAEGNATKSYQDQQDQVGTARNQDLSALGKWESEQNASLGANKQDINAILDQIGSTDDVNELTSIQNAIRQKLIDSQTQRADLGTSGGYLKQIQAAVPAGDQTASLQANLRSIIQGQAPPVLKKSVASKLVQTSGLSADQQQALLAQFNDQVDQQNQG